MKKSKTTIKASEVLAGRWVRVRWDDVGVRDSVVVETDSLKEGKAGQSDSTKTIVVYSPFDEETTRIDLDQVVSVGKYLTAKETGL